MGFVASLCVARYLGPELYGTLNYVMSYGAIFLVISNVGLAQIVLRELSKKEVNGSLLLGAAFKIKICFSVLCTVLLYGVTFIDPHFTSETRLLTLVFSFSFFLRSFEFFSSQLQAQLKGNIVAYAEITQSLISLILKLLLIFSNVDLLFFIIVSALEWGFIFLGLVGFGKKIPAISWRKGTWKIGWALLKDAHYYVYAGLAAVIYNRIDQIMINNLLGTTDVGHYASAVRITEISTMVPTLIGTALFPVVVKSTQTQKDRNKNVQSYFDIVIWSGIIVGAFVYFFSEPLVKLCFGNPFLAAIPALQIMAWKGVTRGIDATFSRWMLLNNLQKHLVGRQVLGCIINIVLNYYFIPWLGILGASIATLLSVISVVLISALIPDLRPCLHFQIKALLSGLPRSCAQIKIKFKKKELIK